MKPKVTRSSASTTNSLILFKSSKHGLKTFQLTSNSDMYQAINSNIDNIKTLIGERRETKIWTKQQNVSFDSIHYKIQQEFILVQFYIKKNGQYLLTKSSLLI